MIKICITGDSISANPYSSAIHPLSLGDFLAMQIPNCKTRNITYPSDDIALQTMRWNQLTSQEKLSFDFIISMNGNNDGYETMKNDYPTFFALIRTQIKPSCKIVSLTLTPAGGASGLTSRNNKNGFVGGTATPSLLGIVDVFVTDHTSYLDDGTNVMKTKYWATSLDPLHINPAGLEVIADSVFQKLKSLGLV